MSEAAAATPPPSEDAYDRLFALVAQDMARVNAESEARMRSEHTDLIPKVASHLIGAGGKRIRPVVTLAAAGICGYEGEAHLRLAAAVEFIHNATLLHDDVVDETDTRRGRATAHTVFGPKPSVLVGDFLFARSFQLMVETGHLEVLRLLSDAAAVIVEGEVLQLAHAGALAGGEDVYFQVVRGKTAALFEAAAESGAVVAGVDAEKREALRVYGDALGVAFQIADDLLDYGGAAARTGKAVGTDFGEGKATLPVLHAYAAGGAQDRAFWERVIIRRDQREGDFDHGLELLRETGALEATRASADAFAATARAALAPFPDGPLKRAMGDIADFVVARAH